MPFQPAFCPCEPPEVSASSGFQYQRRGTYRRVCDGRLIQRYQCKRCKRTFSNQTFRVDRGLHKPTLDRAIFMGLVSKVSQRQIARDRSCSRGTIARRLRRYGEHCRAFHRLALQRRGRAQPWEGHFQLDELETYETDRRLKPVTVPLLVHQPSRCILHVEVGTLPPRKPLPPAKQRQLARIEAEEQKKRRSESRVKVNECFERLKEIAPEEGPVLVSTDEKPTYRAILKRLFGARLVHRRTNSKEPRTFLNPLFLVNHTFAMLRDGLGRLVRRNWGATKEREKLEWHLWLYIGWRNYVRSITNKRPQESAAMVAGLAQRRLDPCELLQWRIFDSRSAQETGPESAQGSTPTSTRELRSPARQTVCTALV
jgi:transposase-like protein